MDTTLDGLLNRQLMLEQPKAGFRIAIDTIFLSAAVPAKPQQSVLELGCGVGGAMLCLGFRVPGLKITGIDIQDELVYLCENNIIYNGFKESLNVKKLAVGDIPNSWHESFDHIMMNPPYHNEKTHTVSPQLSRRIANAEVEGDINIWVDKAAQCLRHDGVLTIVHRADRNGQLCEVIFKKFGRIEILPLLPKEGNEAKRILLRAYKIGKGTHHMRPLVLHDINNRYTQEADSILRSGHELDFVPL